MLRGGRGAERTPASCIWFTRPFLFCPPRVLHWETWPPGVPPAAAAAAAAIATQFPVLRSQLHRSHNLGCPFLLPHRRTTTQASDSKACHPPPPREATAFSTSHARAQTHKHETRAPTGGHMPFPPLLSLFLISFNFVPFSSP